MPTKLEECSRGRHPPGDNADTADTTTYTYDYANRLQTANTALAFTFAYNGDGLRMQKTVDDVPTDYLWDVNASLPVIITDANSLYGLLLIAMQEGGNISYYHQDALGSVRNLTDGAGRLTISYGYDPFGRGTYASGSSDNPFRYTGQYLDNYIDLYYLRARYYQAGTGRFVTRDTIVPDFTNPQALNYYAYVQNNPLRYSDPTGHFAFAIPLVVVGAVVVAGWAYFGIAATVSQQSAPVPIVDPRNVFGRGLTRPFDWGPSETTKASPPATGSYRSRDDQIITDDFATAALIAAQQAATSAEMCSQTRAVEKDPTILMAQREKGMLDEIGRERKLTPDQRQRLGRAVEKYKGERSMSNRDKLSRRDIERIADEKGLDNRK